MPTEIVDWPIENSEAFSALYQRRFWHWPQRPVFFIADPHADPDAFLASLIASGGVEPGINEKSCFHLTSLGQQALFIIGGDCLGKGPQNLPLLRMIKRLKTLHAKVILLAGNHDIRLLLALRTMGLMTSPTTEHLFVNMSVKAMPLLKEVFDTYLQDKLPDIEMIESEFFRQYLFPSEQWPEQFTAMAKERISTARLNQELNRTFKRVANFEKVAAANGLALWQVYQAALKCKELFFESGGEFFWFFEEMQLLHQEGSFLYLHAGIDDKITEILAADGADYLNQLFRHQIEKDLFSFYYGPLANTVWTKYRDSDWPLTEAGVQRALSLGVHAVVHGHRSQLGGQHLRLRSGLIHVEADTTLNCNSRAKLGVTHAGAAVTVISPEGYILGMSNDYPQLKRFRPKRRLQPFPRVLQAIFK